MTANLSHNLFSKHQLKFGDNGKFKILMISDIQETLDYDVRSLENIDKLVEHTSPDLVVICGDICNHSKIKTEEELKAYLDIFTSPMEKRRIPWAHVFGNHDHDVPVDDLKMAEIYESYPYCISKHTSEIYGTTNFVIPIKHSNNDDIAFNVWGMDTNNCFKDFNAQYADELKPLKKPYNASIWDIVHFEQLMWYWNSSKELEDYCNSRVNGMMFTHIAPWEFQIALDNVEQTGTHGNMAERMDLGLFNSGLFSTILQRGDIKCIACGHTHKDDFCGSLCGVTFCLDACAGYSPYGIDDLRGGRCFEIDENDTSSIKTHMIHYSEL